MKEIHLEPKEEKNKPAAKQTEHKEQKDKPATMQTEHKEQKDKPATKQTEHKVSDTQSKKQETEHTQTKTAANKKAAENLYTEDALELAGMSRKERHAYQKERRKKRLAEMDPKEKRDYILHYYRWHILGGILAVFLAVVLARTLYRTQLPLELMVAITNDGTNATAESYIPSAFRDYYSLDNKNIIQVYTDLSIQTNVDDVTVQENSLTDYEKIIVYISSNKLDAIIGDEEALEYYKSTGDIAILDTALPSDLYEQVEEKVVEVTDETDYMNSGKPYAAAIDISDTSFVQKCNLSYDKVYLMLPNNRYDNNENSLRLIRLIFGL